MRPFVFLLLLLQSIYADDPLTLKTYPLHDHPSSIHLHKILNQSKKLKVKKDLLEVPEVEKGYPLLPYNKLKALQQIFPSAKTPIYQFRDVTANFNTELFKLSSKALAVYLADDECLVLYAKNNIHRQISVLAKDEQLNFRRLQSNFMGEISLYQINSVSRKPTLITKLQMPLGYHSEINSLKTKESSYKSSNKVAQGHFNHQGHRIPFKFFINQSRDSFSQDFDKNKKHYRFILKQYAYSAKGTKLNGVSLKPIFTEGWQAKLNAQGSPAILHLKMKTIHDFAQRLDMTHVGNIFEDAKHNKLSCLSKKSPLLKFLNIKPDPENDIYDLTQSFKTLGLEIDIALFDESTTTLHFCGNSSTVLLARKLCTLPQHIPATIVNKISLSLTPTSEPKKTIQLLNFKSNYRNGECANYSSRNDDTTYKIYLESRLPADGNAVISTDTKLKFHNKEIDLILSSSFFRPSGDHYSQSLGLANNGTSKLQLNTVTKVKREPPHIYTLISPTILKAQLKVHQNFPNCAPKKKTINALPN